MNIEPLHSELNRVVFFSKRLFTAIDALARQRSMSILLVFFLSFGGSWLFSECRGIPIPFDQDEASYLLAADTFAHGRLTNPPHPMGKHFETFNVLQQPTYMSKYPPAQGFFMAIGQVLFGHPIYGVWLSVGLMCAAICWMLYAWVSCRWALVGGLIVVMQFGIFTYWSQSYWGGAAAGLGGALVFGALPRIFKMQRIRDAFWLGVGAALLANSRPFEGFFVAIPVGLLVLPWEIKWKRMVKHKFTRRIILPLGLILLLTAVGMGVYNKQITGNARILPYFLYTETYREVPLFIWQPLLPPVKFNHPIMGLFERNFLEKNYFYKKTWKGFVDITQNDIVGVLFFFFGYPLAIPSLTALMLFFHRRTAMRFWAALFVLLGACAAITCPAKPHYFASLTCLVVLWVLTGLKALRILTLRKKRVGLTWVLLLIMFQFFLDVALTPVLPKSWSLGRAVQSTIHVPMSFTREQLKNILMSKGGRYLVIVTYPMSHNFHYEWVYNDADIDHAPIVWARDMGEGDNKELLDYFKDRQVLFIQVFWDRADFLPYRARI
jgi:hypothetical protein